MKNDTSWNKSKQWYSSIVGTSGHYYHQHTVLPVATKLLTITPASVLLDVGCGQGVLARTIKLPIEYWGIDNSKALLKEATSLDKDRKHKYIWGDATAPLAIPKAYFTHAAIILALQNMKEIESVFKNIMVLDPVNMRGIVNRAICLNELSAN
jgi:ubiquinone/menaquinone biosynthesis C-methylase UbiE